MPPPPEPRCQAHVLLPSRRERPSGNSAVKNCGVKLQTRGETRATREFPEKKIPLVHQKSPPPLRQAGGRFPLRAGSKWTPKF